MSKSQIFNTNESGDRNLQILFNLLRNNKVEQFIEYFEIAIESGADINLPDEQHNYLLHYACKKNFSDVVKLLLDNGARVDIVDVDGRNILYYPIRFNYIELMRLLLQYSKKNIGVSIVDSVDKAGYVPVHYAIKLNNYYALQELLLNSADLSFKTMKSYDTLHIAVQNKNIDMLKLILKYIKNIDVKTPIGETCLHIACKLQNLEIIRILLKKGANVNIQEYDYDFSPIFYSVLLKNYEIFVELMNYDINLNAQDFEGKTVVHHIIENEYNDFLDHLMQKTIIISSKYTNNYVQVAEKNIDPNITNTEGKTLGHLLLYGSDPDKMKYIENVLPHMSLNIQDNKGNTLMHMLCGLNIWKNHKDVLVNKKINIYTQNNYGKNVLSYIPFIEREEFIDLVVSSYFNQLKKKDTTWQHEWQNKCLTLDECYKNIREQIEISKESYPMKKARNVVSVDIFPHVKYTTFTGTSIDIAIGVNYIVSRHKNVFTLYTEDNYTSIDEYVNNKSYVKPEITKCYESVGITIDEYIHIFTIEIIWINQKIIITKEFENKFITLVKNKKEGTIIMPIGIILTQGSHSNYLYYDIGSQTLERFEPHGSTYPFQYNYNPNLLDTNIYNKFSNLVKIYSESNLNYITPSMYIPKNGFQMRDTTESLTEKYIGDLDGFCALWCIWYIDLRVRFKHIQPGKLINKIFKYIKQNNLSFRKIIRNFSMEIVNIRDKYLNEINADINDFINNKLTPKQMVMLKKNIFKDII